MDGDELHPIEILDDEEAWRLLRSSSFGRIALSPLGEPEIFPVTFVVDDQRLVFRTAEGTKLVEIAVNERVAFEVDSVTREEAWSVVVKGTARILSRQSEIDAADLLPLRPLVPTLKYTYVEILPRAVTGRRFVPGVEPDRY